MANAKKLKRRRGRPRKHHMPPRIDAPPEDIAQALLDLPADHEWEFLQRQKHRGAGNESRRA